MFLIQSALDDENFPRIAAETSAHGAWETLKNKFLSEKKVITVKLQSLRREFGALAMKSKEPVQEYLSRVSVMVNHMRTYGESLNDEIVVSKVLRSLTSNFDHVVAATEESKDLSQYSFDELMVSLLAHEVRINRPSDKAEEKAFQMKGETNRTKQETSTLKSQGRGGYHGCGRGYG